MTDLEKSATRFVANSRSSWAELVRTALSTKPEHRDHTAKTLAEASGVGKSNLLRKFEAIHMAREDGYSLDAIISMGQARTMSKFVKEKKDERTDALVFMRFGVSPGLREAILQNLWRIGKVLKIKTHEQALEFVNSVLTDLTDDQICALAGDGSKP